MKYYSQYNQDINLDECVFDKFENGFFVDVGAHDGVKFNNTLFFEESRNWTGLNVEANPDVYKDLIINRPNCININVAIDKEEGIFDFYKNTGHTEMLSGLIKSYSPEHKERLDQENESHGSKSEIIKVHSKSLKDIFKEKDIKEVHLLSVDVEGNEMSVFESIDFNEVFIHCLVFEINYMKEMNKFIEYLGEKNYIFINKHHTDVYMVHKDSHFLKNIIRIVNESPLIN